MSTLVVERTGLEEAVRNGASYLDEHIPDWRDEIDTGRLDMQNACNCVLGQLLGNFYDLNKIGLTYMQAYGLGFEARGNNGYAELTAAWRELLAG